MSNIAKVAVENFENNVQALFDLDKNKDLETIVREICKMFDKPQSKSYGLKVIFKKNEKGGVYYLNEENLQKIQHSDCLKLVYSVSYLVKRIFEHISDEYKEQSFKDLGELSVEPEFIKELVRTDHLDELLNIFTNNELNQTENQACLLTIVHLCQKLQITKTEPNFLIKVIKIIKSPESTSKEVQYALAILHKILVNKNIIFKQWKQQIADEIPITEILPYIWSEDDTDLQYNALLLINTLIRYCRGDMQLKLIKEINLKNNREMLYKHIIVPGKLTSYMEHELYVCQTYLLSLYFEALNSSIDLDDNKREEFELHADEIKRMPFFLDFDENDCPLNQQASMENLLSRENSARLSFASVLSELSDLSPSSRSVSVSESQDNLTVSYLTLEALRHYKKYHEQNFSQSQIEEKLYEPGIFVTSERVVKILAKILHIGQTPKKFCTFYQPIVFYSSPKKPFFLELFSRTMWLLSKTRREMKASTIGDYNKVMNVLEKQIFMVLEQKPMDFKKLTDAMSTVTFQTAMQSWQKEKEEELNNVIMTNPSVLQMREVLVKENELFVWKQRMNLIMKGNKFPNIKEKDKKSSGDVFVKLSENMKVLMIFDWDTYKKGPNIVCMSKYQIADITHIAQGKNCNHPILCNQPNLAFALIIQHSERVYFLAKNEQMAQCWIDAIILLMGRGEKTPLYYSDIKTLVDMDIRLRLLELQNVKIPKMPPPIPKPPIVPRPPVPPKPPQLQNMLNRLSKNC